MIETNFNKLMNRSSDLLSEIKGSGRINRSEQFNSVLPANQAIKCYKVLAPENFKWEAIIVNLFNPTEMPQTAPVGTTVLIHGHGSEGTCFTPSFCHVLGYQPVGEHKFWDMKWRSIYATSVSSQ